MKISVIHPTKNRPVLSYETFKNWMRKSLNRIDMEYILSVDMGDLNPYLWEIPSDLDFTILRKNNKSAIEAINNAAKISTGDLLIVISDDFNCPELWDTLLRAIKGKENFLLKTDDGLQPALVTLPIMDKKYYQSFGYVYFPGYEHLFCDQEMTAVAIMTGRYEKSPLIFPHDHHTTGKFPKDDISRKCDDTWTQGELLFNQRLQINFGIQNPVVPYESIQWR